MRSITFPDCRSPRWTQSSIFYFATIVKHEVGFHAEVRVSVPHWHHQCLNLTPTSDRSHLEYQEPPLPPPPLLFRHQFEFVSLRKYHPVFEHVCNGI